MGLGKTLKNMFGARKGEPVIEKFGPLQARLNGQVLVDNTTFLVNDQFLAVENPGDVHTLTHVGTTSVANMPVTRYYLEGVTDNTETILQVAGNDKPDEIIMFRKVDEVHPQEAGAWEEFRETIGEETFEFNGVVYGNVWNALLAHNETVVAAPSLNEETYTYPCETALFKRQISEDNEPELSEYALVAIEDEERVVVYLGINLLPAAVTIN
ncbi:MAG: DUF2491 family protein [Neptunomonas phycophila]|uniref:DUF2491 family protein n=1 Tax=Neptunomonas phycophila TaxID=1572645 RepID=UPI003B8D0ED0